MKTCKGCGICKPLDEFYAAKGPKDGRQGRCKECTKLKQREHAAADVEANRRRVADWRKADPERARESRRASNAKHREAIKHRKRLYYLANSGHIKRATDAFRRATKDRQAIYAKRYRQKNPGRDVAKVRARQASKIQRTPIWADLQLIRDIYLLAAIYRSFGHDVHVDHGYPLRGREVCGLHVPENLHIITARDNRSKGNRMPETDVNSDGLS